MSNQNFSKKQFALRAMMAGRESGTRAILFQQAIAQALGLNATDMKCLDMLVLRGPVTPSQLIEVTGLTSGAITVMIDRLVKAKLVERRIDEADRRRTLLYPTAKAAREVAPKYESMSKAMAKLFSGYSEEELRFLEIHFGEVAQIFQTEVSKLGSAT